MSRPLYLPTALRFMTQQRDADDEPRLPREHAKDGRARRRYAFQVGDSGWVTVSTIRGAKRPATDGV